MNPDYDTPIPIFLKACSALICLVLALALAPATRADDLIARDDKYRIEPGAAYVDIPFDFLRGNDDHTGASIHLVVDDQAPRHGTITTLTDAFRYTPKTTNGLESLRTDSFSYFLDNGVAESYASVHVILRTDNVVLRRADFEFGETPNYVPVAPPGTTVAIHPDAAAVGSQGLSITVPANAPEAFIEIQNKKGPPSESGRVEVVGCDLGGVNQDVMILAVGPSRAFAVGASQESLRVVLRPDGAGGAEIVVEALDGLTFNTSASLPVGPGPHHLDLDWWPATDGPGGAILRLDGEAVQVEYLDLVGFDLSAVQIGVMPLEVATSVIALDFDYITVYEQGRTEGDTVVFSDDFEASSLDPGWDAGHGSGAPVQAGGAISGNFGLLAELAQSNSFHVAEDPSVETELNVRFRLDVSGLIMESSEFLRLFDFGSDADPLYGFPDVNIRLHSIDGAVHIAALSAEPTGLAFSPWQEITGSHTVELQWQRSLGVPSSGYFRFWLDGAPVAARLELDSLSEAVEWLHFGILGVGQATQGNMVLDDLVIWR